MIFRRSCRTLNHCAVLTLSTSFALAACGSSSDNGGAAGASSTAGSASSAAGMWAGGSSAGMSAAGSSAGGSPAGGTSNGYGYAGAAATGASNYSGAGGAAGGPATGEVAYVADLEGYNQVPRVTTTASGSATLTLSADKKTLTYHVKQNVQNATKAHIHLGAAGENGAVVYPLEPLSADMTGSISLTNANDVAQLDAGNFYINVHSTIDADGEVRGQILHTGETLYVANLTTDQETPPNNATSSGSALVIAEADKMHFRYHVQSTIVAPTAAHIHNGLATYAGAHVHVLPTMQTIDGSDVFATGEADDLAQGRWYINVHTAVNAKGEISGQLMLPGEVLYSAAMAGTNEIPAVTSTATGNAQFILSADQKSLRYELALFGVTPTMAHIHKGAAGATGPVVYPLTLVAGYANTPMATAGALGTQAVTAGDLVDLDAGNLYANAHSTEFTTGAARGQITRPKQ
jgi:hypothetical protein